MPRISSFYGITITMYYREHGIPHFHARHGEHEGFDLHFLPRSTRRTPSGEGLRLVLRWATLHREDLQENWDRAQREEVLEDIEPLP
ncbi:MAG: DUF4160 domain-containing protein [Solirubrobacterales bacterium]